jgi:hypothetical protein
MTDCCTTLPPSVAKTAGVSVFGNFDRGEKYIPQGRPHSGSLQIDAWRKQQAEQPQKQSVQAEPAGKHLR